MKKSSTNREKGQSLVELALVFTILLLLVGGIIDLGGLFYTSVALRDTVQEGAIYGATHPIYGPTPYPTETAKMDARIYQSASFPINADQIKSIEVTCGTGDCSVGENTCQGQKIKVTIAYDYHPMTPIFIFNNVQLTASVAATILRTPDETTTYLEKLSQKCP